MSWCPLYELIGMEPFESVTDDLLRVEVVRSADGAIMEVTYLHSLWGYGWVPAWIMDVASGRFEVTVTRARDQRQWTAVVDWRHPSERTAADG